MERFHKKSMTFVSDKNDFNELYHFMKSFEELVIDTETSGLDIWGEDLAFGIGIGNSERQFFIDLRTVSVPAEFWRELNNVLVLIGQNIKFDLSVLLKLGYEVSTCQQLKDIMVMARIVILERFPSLDLDSLIARFITAADAEYSREFRSFMKTNKIKKYSDAPSKEAGIYCMNDVLNETRVYLILREIINKRSLNELWQQEIKTTKTLWNMEKNGIHVDIEYCKFAKNILNKKRYVIQSQIDKFNKEPVNLNSSSQVGKMFKKLKIKSDVKTAGGKESWSETALVTISHPIAEKIKEYRTCQKQETTYFDYFIRKSPIFHPSGKNWGTVTGRLSYDDVIQTLPKISIPISNDLIKADAGEAEKLVKAIMSARKGADQRIISKASSGTYGSWLSLLSETFDDTKVISVRRGIVPKDGNVLLGFDYRQIELRVLFLYLNNDDVNKFLTDLNWDGHEWVAKMVWNTDKNDPNFSFYRGLAKAINFGIIFGEGDKLLAAQIGKTVEEASSFRKLYYEKIPGIKDFMNKLRYDINNKGYVENFFGRQYSVTSDRIYLLVNYMVQGTTADFVKNRMNALDVHNDFVRKHVQQLFQVHDEIVVECRKDAVDEIVGTVSGVLETPIFKIALPVDKIVYYPSYAHKWKYAENKWRDLI